VIDDEKLQDLLGKASSFYNGGQYREAIEAWQAALALDPSNQKASEGVRMATLLLGDWEPAAAGEPAPEPPADGGDAGGTGVNPEEFEAGLALGLAQIRQRMAGREYEAAIDQARDLQTQAPDNEEIQRLLDEAQTGFESQPFVQEHLTLSRELLDQERYAEAESECKKIFVLDKEHPGGLALLKEIRSRIQESLQRAAQAMGGMTVKLNAGDLGVPAAPTAPRRPTPAATPAPPATAPAGGSVAEDSPFELDDSGLAPPSSAGSGGGIAPSAADPDAMFEMSEGVGGSASPPAPERSGPPAGSKPAAFAGPTEFEMPASDGDLAGAQEEVASRNLLDAAFADIDAGVPAMPPAGTAPGPADEAFAPSADDQPEVIEAKTVVKPSVRIVAPAPAASSAKKSAGGAASGSTWEDELSQLNAKEGEQGILRGAAKKTALPPAAAKDATAGARDASAAKPGAGVGKKGAPAGKPGPAPDPMADLDLMSLLDADIGMPDIPGAGAEAAAAPGTGAVAPGRAGQASATLQMPPRPAGAKSRPRPAATADPAGAPDSTPQEDSGVGEDQATQHRPRERGRPAPPPPRPRSSMSKFFLLLVLVLMIAGGAGWWFFFQPRTLSGASARDAMGGSPPGGSAPAIPGGEAPIPTPIGSSGRPQDQEGDAAAVGSPAPSSPAPAGGAAVAALGSDPAGPAVAGTAAPALVGPTGRGGKPPSNEPIKPAEQPTLSPAEAKRRVTTYMADGRRMMQTGKWREARAKLGAVLALDPANFEAKEMLDTAQEKIDAEQKILDEFESTRRLFEEKDYENALRKLYRLPRDKGLGDIDLFIQNTWYTWAVMLLKAGNCRDALVKLGEVLVLNPDDAEALKLQEVAERYQNRAKDKVFYAFVDTLQPRPMTKR
jgi:tetratricopeptide (TPR) repeat protein